MKNRFVAGSAVLWGALISCVTVAQDLIHPNIVVLFVDDLGYNDLGFRNNQFETPYIDRLAGRSLEFSNAYIASPTSSPSRATLLTGKHPRRLQMVRHIPGGKKYGFDEYSRTTNEFHILETDPAQMPSRNWLPLEEITYAEALKEQGYQTAFIGKWHLGHEEYYPSRQGFDVQYGVSNLGHPVSYFPPYFSKSDEGGSTSDTGEYLTDYLTDYAVQYLNNHQREKPFLLHVSYYAVHAPHQGKANLVKKYEEKGFEGKYAHYGAMVTAVDQSVGRIMEALEKNGFDENTVVIFLSDQGGYFSNAPLRGGKTGGEALFEGGAKVQFLVRWPGVTKEGDVCLERVQSTDLFPTLVELAGGKVEAFPDLDGKSLLPLLKDSKASLNRDAIYFYRSYEDRYAAIITGDWKLIAHRSGTHELYNLKNDPYETMDLATEKREIVAELAERIEQWEKTMNGNL